jgi:flagellar hook-associated protein 1 FlgK
MFIAVQALMAEQGALSVTSNNIANVNTPGYSRQIAVLDEAPTFKEGNLVFGSGVTLQQFQSVRDQLLQLRIYEETQQQGNSQAQLSSLTQIEGLFADGSSGIGGALTTFFNSLSQLSTDPANMSARQQVLTSANNLAGQFHQAVAALGTLTNGLDQTVPQAVSQINQFTQQIADLNGQVSQMQGVGKDPGSIQDQRDELVRQLSQVINISVTQTEHGITLTTANGVPLVVGGQSFDLQASTNTNGLYSVMAQDQDITSQITGGSLAGMLTIRDGVIPDVLNRLDTLANELTSAFNTQHQAGTDLLGNQGQDFFTTQAAVAGSAQNFGVAITDPRLVAASSDGSEGSSGNVVSLLALRDQALPSGASPTQMYANLVLQVGNYGANAKADVTAGDLSLQQLTDQRSAISGVSLDEETTNMMRYQRAYQAAAKVVTTVDEMLQTLMNMVGA